MAYESSATVAASASEVFSWHERPGALIRLTPPWLPIRVLSEADSLRSGRALLRVGGIAVQGRHAPAAYAAGRSFGDEVVASGAGRLAGAALRWRHLHLFEGDSSTTVTDRVATTVPDRVLRRVFRYRQAQLADDLASHRALARLAGAAELRVLTPRPLRIAMTGSSGLVGRALAAFLTGGGHEVLRLVRRAPRGVDERRWYPRTPDPDLLRGVDAVVHLAGESIFGRFSAAHKREIAASRLEPTRRLAALAAESGVATFVSASAIGRYGADRGDEVLDEAAQPGSGFLAEVVAEWEQAALEQAGPMRVVSVRTGVVQSATGGVLGLYRPLYGAGLGGAIGRGDQWLSWIGLDDIVDVYARALADPSLVGPVNAVSPNPVSARAYAHTLARVLRRPGFWPVPRTAPRALLGTEGSRELAEASQRVVPGVLLAAGHGFRHPYLEQVLRHELGR